MEKTKFKTSICIIGAGVIGLTLAKELQKQGHKDILVLEKGSSVAEQASGRNSGVLHAGIYYQHDTLKAQFCLDGNLEWQSFCKENALPLLETGKLIVAKSKSEQETLHTLYKQAKENGANVKIVKKNAVTYYEPLAKTTEEALYSKSTAILNPKHTMEFLKEQLATNGTTFLFNTKVTHILSKNSLQTTHGIIQFERLINAAGAYSDVIAQHCGIAKNYRLIPFKGLYKQLNPDLAKSINGNIYPVPDLRNPFLGVHFTKSTQGDVYVGPTAIPAFGAENYHLLDDLGSHSLRILWQNTQLFLKNPKFRSVALTEPKYYLNNHFYNAAKQLVHTLKKDDLRPSAKCGIRPQLVNWKTKELMMDFVIETSEHGIHILNAISPAFTCAPAFSKYVVKHYF